MMRKFFHLAKRFLVLIIMINVIVCSPGFAHPVLDSTYAKVVANALLLDAPRPDANIVATIWPNDTVLLVQRLGISDGGDYTYCLIDDVPEGSPTIGYVMTSCLEYMSDRDAASSYENNQSLAASDGPPPVLPGSKMPLPINDVWLTDRGRHAVYDAPGTNSHRSRTATGKEAYVSGNEEVVLLARDGNWAFIEYRTKTGYRRGYVPESCIPSATFKNAGTIPNAQMTGRLRYRAQLVNDTSMQNDAYIIETLSMGSEIQILAFDHSWGRDWVYIEMYYKNKLTRGFIEMVAIELQ